MSKKIQLSVRERIDAALKIARRDSPRSEITISELSRLAGVSRANLYTSHRDVVVSLQSDFKENRPRQRSADPSEKLKQLRKELRDEVHKNRALVYLVIELRAELQRTRDQLANEERAKSARLKRR